VVAVRALKNAGTDEFGQLQIKLLKELDGGKLVREQAQEKVEEFWIGKLRSAVIDGDVKYGSLMAGQSVGLVKQITSVKEILNELVTDAENELQRVQKQLCGAD
ncbi:pyruvate formate lyase family protein, partial [Oligoflexia bacterium]|nr:pyruvate formate lyase family protein [Oligoflexia bacterium]